jgi:hypothetical protein
MNVSPKPIKTFLDAVDLVLNSNTFLLHFYAKTSELNADLANFLKSESFMEQLAEQDKERGWYMLHYFDEQTESYRLRNGNILKDSIALSIEEVQQERMEYLRAMLRGDTTKGPFFSFYAQQLGVEEARSIVDDFSSFISGHSEWRLFIIEPDFLKSAVEVYAQEGDLRYFEGDYGNDSATVILTRENGYLLLTNGID